MQLDFDLGRARRDSNVPDILRVDNCSEVDVAGRFYKQDGKYYDYCCDLQNENECQTWFPWWAGALIMILFWCCVTCNHAFCCVCKLFRYCFNCCANAFCCQRPSECCERQTPVRNDNNVTGYSTERPNISTISANIRYPPRPIATVPPPSTSSSTPPSSEIEEVNIDQFPRSKASENECTGRRKYFF